MKKSLYLFLLVFGTLALNAQHKQYQRIHEFGAGIGALNYTGDLAENIKLKYSKPALNAFYRHNFTNEVSVLRVNFMVGRLGVDEAKSNEALRKARKYSFNGTLLEASLLYEYDFFDFRDIENKYYMSPYLYGGLSANTFVGQKNSDTFAGIPFGAGIKFRLNGGWNLGAEIGARKNFTDKLDGYTDEIALGTSILTDWTYHAGVNFSYTFYSLICPDKVPDRVKRK